MQQRRDRTPSRFTTSLLAVALVVSTLVVPASAMAAGAHACCTRVAGQHAPPVSVKCCAPDRPDGVPQPTPPPQAPKAPAPDLTPLLPSAAIVPPLLVPHGAPVACLRQLVDPPQLYLLYSTLIV